MIIDKRKEKQCSKCKEIKGPDGFYVTRIKNKKTGDLVMYCTGKCKDCNNKPRKKPKPLPTEKRCHNCCKYKPGDQYRKYKYRNEKAEQESNWCNECEAKYGNYTISKAKGIKPTVNTSEDSAYLCAFIGNVSYKEICKIYGIRYEEN